MAAEGVLPVEPADPVAQRRERVLLLLEPLDARRQLAPPPPREAAGGSGADEDACFASCASTLDRTDVSFCVSRRRSSTRVVIAAFADAFATSRRRSSGSAVAVASGGAR